MRRSTRFFSAGHPRHLFLALFLAAAAALAGAAATEAVTPIGSAFTYQGSLASGGVPSNGLHDLRFELYDASSGGTQMGGTVSLNAVPVTDGVFSVTLDFGSSWFIGEARWLRVEVRASGSGSSFTDLGRQELTPTPFAIGLSLPHQQAYSTSGYVFQMRNTGSGGGGRFVGAGSTTTYGVLGQNSSTGSLAAGVRGEASAASGVVIGVDGSAEFSPSGLGIRGRGKAIGGVFEGTGAASDGVQAFGYSRGIYAENFGTGSAAYFVGKGQTKNNATVRVTNTEANGGMAAYLLNTSTFATAHLQNNGTGEVLWLDNNGAGHFIVAQNPSGWKFWVDNSGTTHTKVLEILGGADLSEQFDVETAGFAPEPGMVVSIDPAREGRLTPSRTAYDRKVAGILSGAGGVNPGMIMGQKGSVADGEHPVALSGRVYCFVDANYAPIEPGDLLTTSDTPGYAMKATDPGRTAGAVLGKAMSSLHEGRGLILVLVGLQ